MGSVKWKLAVSLVTMVALALVFAFASKAFARGDAGTVHHEQAMVSDQQVSEDCTGPLPRDCNGAVAASIVCHGCDVTGALPDCIYVNDPPAGRKSCAVVMEGGEWVCRMGELCYPDDEC
jgi:hypothetical protein